jgi:hypothetical protein
METAYLVAIAHFQRRLLARRVLQARLDQAHHSPTMESCNLIPYCVVIARKLGDSREMKEIWWGKRMKRMMKKKRERPTDKCDSGANFAADHSRA